MLFWNLSGVINAMRQGKREHSHATVLHVRRILCAMRYSGIPLYVVVRDNGDMFTVSDYMAAMLFKDEYKLNVWSVWRDDDCAWHVVEQ